VLPVLRLGRAKNGLDHRAEIGARARAEGFLAARAGMAMRAARNYAESWKIRADIHFRSAGKAPGVVDVAVGDTTGRAPEVQRQWPMWSHRQESRPARMAARRRSRPPVLGSPSCTGRG